MITYNHFKWRNSPLDLGAGLCDPHHFCYTLLQAGHHVSSLFSFSSGQKDHLILVVVAATTTIFTFRNNASEQYQKNIDIVRNNIKEKPTLFRNFSTLFRKRLFTLFALFWAVILIFNRKKLSKFAENSLNSPKIRFAYYEKRIFKLSKR